MKKFIFSFLVGFLALSFPFYVVAQIEGDEILSLIGKSVKDPKAAEFLKQVNPDPDYGINYENGVRVYTDGNRISRIYLYFEGWVEGKKMNTFKWKFPGLIHSNFTIYDAERYFGPALEKYDQRAIFVKDGVQIEIVFKDEQMLQPSYVHLMK